MTVETIEKYCPICGKEVTEATFKRFGEWTCSDAHAEEYVKEVRTQRVKASASAPASEERAGVPHRMCCG
jgi:endogenous inhibitor of DNA gyrase (YacG/DUF329 family)